MGIYLYPGNMLMPPQRTAHHAAGARSEQVVHSVEGQHQRRHQSDGGILYWIVEHAHKIGVRQVIDDGNQGADDCGYDKLPYRCGY